MIQGRIIGQTELIQALVDAKIFLAAEEIDAVMQKAAKPIADVIKSNYLSAGLKRTGALVNSIQVFRGSKRSRKYDSYTYYIGPKYSTKNSLSAGGNAAHLLEWGTKVRHRADVKNGGFTGKGTGRSRTKIYGAQVTLGGVKAYGILRKSYDQTKAKTQNFLSDEVLKLIYKAAKQEGFIVK